MTMTGKEVLELLKRNGWKLNRITGSHHVMIKNGRSIAVPLHGNRDLPPGTLNKILKDAGLK